MDDIELSLSTDTGLTRRTLWPSLQLVFKRTVDVMVALALITVLSPVLLAVVLAVRLSSPGPALFRQRRWGRGARQFVCWKFRTMHVDQDSLVDVAMLRRVQSQGVLFKKKNDPRITPVGAFLRKTSLDELPQLFNVLVGDMSLIGPRPLMLHMLEPYPELREVRGQMRPGITGLWQISARQNNETALQMAPFDLAYVREFNLWIDLKIMLKTPAAVLFGKGAY